MADASVAQVGIGDLGAGDGRAFPPPPCPVLARASAASFLFPSSGCHSGTSTSFFPCGPRSSGGAGGKTAGFPELRIYIYPPRRNGTNGGKGNEDGEGTAACGSHVVGGGWSVCLRMGCNGGAPLREASLSGRSHWGQQGVIVTWDGADGQQGNGDNRTETPNRALARTGMASSSSPPPQPGSCQPRLPTLFGQVGGRFKRPSNSTSAMDCKNSDFHSTHVHDESIKQTSHPQG